MLLACQCHSKTYKYIFVIIDHLTKMQHIIPITGLSTEKLVNSFINNVYKLYSALSIIIFDYST